MMKSATLALSLVMASSITFAERAQVQNLSDSIPYPFYEVQKASDGKFNDLMVINSGIAAFQKRLELIRKAQNNIEVEYFIYATDESSRIMTQELVRAAKRGVKVRILVDKSAAIFVFDEFYAKALHEVKNEAGEDTDIEVKYYNGAALLRLSSINFRNHRKLLSVDDKYAITGGRNIENDYFDLADDFNFLDRDVYVEGDIVPTLRKSFDKYFEHEISETPSLPIRPEDTIKKKVKRLGGKFKVTKIIDNTKNVEIFKESLARSEEFLVENNQDRLLKNKVSRLGGQILETKKSFTCPELTYSTDAPGGDFLTRLKDDYSDDYRFLRKTLYDKLADPTLTNVLLASPYMINNGFSKELMNSLVDRNVDLTLYTNSLASTDAVYVAANLYIDFTKWTKMGIKVFVHDGLYMDEGHPPFKPSLNKAMWGMHSKTQVYESENNSEVMIGTYNIDNRSNHYNSEMAIFCKGSADITNEVKDSINHRIASAYELHSDRTATTNDGKKVSIYGSNEDSLFMMRLIAIKSWLLKPLL